MFGWDDGWDGYTQQDGEEGITDSDVTTQDGNEGIINEGN